MAGGQFVSKPLKVLLVPGLLCTEQVFARQAAHLGSLGCEVLSPTWPLRDVKDMAGIARHMLDTYTDEMEKVAVAGISMGGYVALEMLRQQPGHVSGVALLASHPLADTPVVRDRRRAQVAAARAAGNLDAVMEAQLPMLLHSETVKSDDGTPSHAVGITRQMAVDSGVDGFEAQQLAMLSRCDNCKTLETPATLAGTPLFVIGSDNDSLIPWPTQRETFGHALRSPDTYNASPQLDEESQHVADRCQREVGDGSTPVALWHLPASPPAGHLVTLESPDAVNEALTAWVAAVREHSA